MKINLLTKGLVLVAIPLCFEITLFGILLDLQNKVEREAERVAISKQANDAINTILHELLEVGQDVKGFMRLSAIRSKLQPKMNYIHQNFDQLKQLLKNDPEKLAAVLRSEQGIYSAERHLDELMREIPHTSMNELQDVLLLYRRKINNDFTDTLGAGLLKLAQDRRQQTDDDQSLAIRKSIRDLLKIALAFSVIVATSGAFLFSRHLSGRLSQLNVNAKRLANEEPLLPLLAGNDEIAQLDRTFHLASDLLNKATQKEKAILKNARDIIMSIDKGLSIVSVNPAAANAFERSESELIGMRFSSLLNEEEGQKASEYFNNLQKGETSLPLELTIRMPSGAELIMSLSGSYSESERTYYLVLHDVTSSKQIEQIRREVTAMITHDLKTPLQNISFYLQMLRLGKIGELTERGQNLLSHADSSCERMSRLIESVLDLEKIRSGSTELKLESISLSTFLPKCAQAIAILANAKEIAVKTESPEPDLQINGDTHWLQQVIVNLLANAINYSPEKTVVTLSCQPAETFAELLVCDEGPGIPDADKSIIFERFRRLDKMANEVAGSGLGLTFCKEMVELHRGYIRVEDNQPRGTKFIVGIPLHPSNTNV